MNAEIIAVGTELLLGDILNTNAQYLARQLAGLGFTVWHQSVVGDNPQRLAQLADQARQRSQLVIYSGGLGPTADDLTKETIAAAYGDTLRFDEEQYKRITDYFTASGRSVPANNRKQAMVPVHGRTLQNDNGTAPGVVFEQDGRMAILLPGPPKELVPMFENQVRPLLETMQDGVLYSRILRVYGIGESRLEELVGHLLEGSNPTAALYAKTAEVTVRVTAKGDTLEAAKVLCGQLADEFYRLLGDAVYDEGEEGMEKTVVQLYTRKRLQLATAESCTGGLVSQRITSVPGSSDMFQCGVCSYANQVKARLLGVREATLDRFGAVSLQVAGQMALGVRDLARADVGVGITGIAGPGGGSAEKPVGLVYIGAANQEGVWVYKMLLPGRSRDTVRWAASQKALDMARRLAAGLPLADCVHCSDAQLDREV